MKRTVIANSNLPTFNPVWKLATILLIMDRFKAPGWAWGAFFALALLVVIHYFTLSHEETPASIEGFGEKK